MSALTRTINPMSWGRRLAREAIRRGKIAPKMAHLNGSGGRKAARERYYLHLKHRKKFADMARTFKKKG